MSKIFLQIKLYIVWYQLAEHSITNLHETLQYTYKANLIKTVKTADHQPNHQFESVWHHYILYILQGHVLIRVKGPHRLAVIELKKKRLQFSFLLL